VLRTGAVTLALLLCGASAASAAPSNVAPTQDTTPPSAPAGSTPTGGSTAPGSTTDTSGSGTTQPGVVQSWTLAPAGSLDGSSASNRPNLSYESSAGSSIDDAVTVYNFGNVPMIFKIYATDAFNNEAGEFDVLPAAKAPVDAGSWVSMPVENISLDPGKQVTIPIKIQIPIDAAPGDHVGGVLASNVSKVDNGDGQVVNLDRRTGTRMYIRVGGQLRPELGVTDVSTKYHQSASPLGGNADVSFRVENRGNVRLSGSPTVSIEGPLGIGTTKVKLPPMTELLPGQHVVLKAHLTGVPTLFVGSTTVAVSPAGSVDASTLKAVTGAETSFVPPIFALLVLLALVLLLLVVRAIRRHRRNATQALAAAQELMVEHELEHQST
jgi:hypothetical protein